MKLWVKLLAGTIIGVLLGIFLPGAEGGPSQALDFFKTLIIHIGRYAVFPLVFFSLVIGTYGLKSVKKMGRSYLELLILILATSAGAVIISAILVFILTPQRIPIIIEQGVIPPVPNVSELVLGIFPKDGFQVFIQNADYLLPLCVLAVILGLSFDVDIEITSPIVEFFNAMSRIVYWVNSLIVEILSFLMIILVVHMLFQIRSINDIEFFRELLIILAILTFLIVFVIYPLLIYFLGGKKNPTKWLYAMIAPALTAFFSGDGYYSLGLLIRIGKESLGIPRKLGSAVFPLSAVFARAGSAMVTCVSFIIILRSYSSLELSFLQILWVMGFSFLISFLLGSVPGMAPVVGLSFISALYGRGMEEGFLILKPLSPLLISFAVLVDVFTAGFIAYLLGLREKLSQEVEIEEFA